MVGPSGVAGAVPRRVSGDAGVSEVPIREVPVQVPGVNSVFRMVPHTVASAEGTTGHRHLKRKETTAKKREIALAIQLESVKANLMELALQLERTKSAIPIAQNELVDAGEKLTGIRWKLATAQAQLKSVQEQKAKLQGDIESDEKTATRIQVAVE